MVNGSMNGYARLGEYLRIFVLMIDVETGSCTLEDSYMANSTRYLRHLSKHMWMCVKTMKAGIKISLGTVRANLSWGMGHTATWTPSYAGVSLTVQVKFGLYPPNARRRCRNWHLLKFRKLEIAMTTVKANDVILAIRSAAKACGWWCHFQLQPFYRQWLVDSIAWPRGSKAVLSEC